MKLFKKKEKDKSCQFQIALLGLEETGKTSFLFYLKFGDIVTTVPTEGFNCQAISYKKRPFSIYDWGGTEKVRQRWYDNGCVNMQSHGYMFFIDATKPDTFPLAKTVLHDLAKRVYSGKSKPPIVVVGNKIDLPNPKNEEESVYLLNSLLQQTTTKIYQYNSNNHYFISSFLLVREALDIASIPNNENIHISLQSFADEDTMYRGMDCLSSNLQQ
jgi:GTPase SAR1 family protein